MKKNWNENISSEDTVVLAGDSSWAMNIRDAYEDFCWIEKMPGKKILLKKEIMITGGVHAKKMEDTFSSWGFSSEYSS